MEDISNATVEHVLEGEFNSSSASDDGNTVVARQAALEQRWATEDAALEQRRAIEDATKRKRRAAEVAELHASESLSSLRCAFLHWVQERSKLTADRSRCAVSTNMQFF